MLCSKCKVISIHLPNYDSYICENGHILCRACNDRIRQKCSICGGRIVRQTEFRLEGVPTAFFKNSLNEPVIYSDVDSECERTYRSDSNSAGGLGNGWPYHYSRDYDSECGSVDKASCCEDLNWNLKNGNVNIGDYYYMSFCKNAENIACLPNNVSEANWQQQEQQLQEGRRENSSMNFKENKSQVNLKQSKSICKFKTPSLDENYIVNMPKSPQYDPKELYHKTINGEVDFDPKLDYYQKSAQVNEIQEFFKRPNLELARKSSSRMEFKERSIQSDSVTLLEHLNEFRNATNYIPPPEIEVYSINENPMRSEPTIITKSKNNVKKESFGDYSVREKIDECKMSQKTSEQKDKVDVGTMIDLCIDPCLNLVNFHSLGSCAGDYGSCNQIINQMSKSIGAHTNNNNSNKEFEQVKENTVNIERMEPTSVIDEKEFIAPNTQMSLRNLLREKLRSEVYSQFEKSPVQQRNNFMTKTRYKPNPVVGLHVDSLKDMNRTNITEIINQEIEKALNKLSAPEDVMTPIQKREEIIRQSKNQVRERLLQQIYSNFNDKTNSVKSTFSKSESTLGQLSSREILSEKQIEVKDYAEPINDDNNSYLCTCHTQAKELRNVALSTESYPKLNPQLAVLTVPKARMQVSATISDNKITHESKCSCNAQTSCDMPIIHLQDDAEKDVICEIQKQFEDQQRQITLQQLESLRSMSKFKSQSLTSTPAVIDADAEDGNVAVVQSKSNICVENLPSKEKKLDRGNGYESKYKIFEESHISKLSEGPFKQSCGKTPFESSAESPYPNPLGNQFFDLPTAVTVATIFQTENLMKCISYPEKSVSDEKMIQILKEDDPVKVIARTLADDFREEPVHKSENDIDIPDFIKFLKEKFPNISLKEIKDVVVNLPYDNLDQNAELCTEVSFDETFGSKHNLITSNDTLTEKNLETTENFSNFSSVTVNAWRAFYSPPSTEVDASSEPTPQFRVISRLDLEGSLLENSLKEIRIAADLNIPRSPVICPITTCNKLIFVSEFSKHIKVDHVKIPVESISPGNCKNLFLDPKVDHHGVNKCHILYLVTDKIRDLGSREYKDFLPVLVMSTKVSLLELVCSEYRTRNREVARNRQNFLMIWLTGLSPTDLPIYFSLTAWSRCGPIPKCHIVHSGKLYSIRNGQDARSLFRNGQVLLLSNEQCCMLTNDGRNMIELQVVVH